MSIVKTTDGITTAAPPDGVVVAWFRSREEGVLALRMLLDSGFAARLTDDREHDLPAPDGLPLVGVALMVTAGEAEDARRMIAALWPVAEPKLIAAAPDDRCPGCGSSESSRLPRLHLFLAALVLATIAGFISGQMRLFMLTVAVVAVALLLTPDRRCVSCGERWRSSREAPEENATEVPDIACPRCSSTDTHRIDNRRRNGLTLIVNLILPPLLLVWPFLPKWRCDDCENEWR